MTQISALHIRQRRALEWHLRMFTPLIRSLWVALLLLTVVSEVIPIPLLPPKPFYTYKALKVLCFVLIGYLAPLAFWRFNALNRGILYAALCSSFVETLQGLLHHGHSFHWYELIAKLVLTLIGFTTALEARYDNQIKIGNWRVVLIDGHMDRKL